MLFDNCTEERNFGQRFSRCSKLKKIPENLFDRCLKVEDFGHTFDNCPLVGNPIKLWERVENGNENSYIGLLMDLDVTLDAMN